MRHPFRIWACAVLAASLGCLLLNSPIGVIFGPLGFALGAFWDDEPED